MSVEGRTTGGQTVRVEIDADGQPGYLTTARMLGEAGLLLAEPGATPERSGCLTPAIALGTGSWSASSARGCGSPSATERRIGSNVSARCPSVPYWSSEQPVGPAA